MTENHLTSIPNKVANIAFAGKLLQQRKRVYKKRVAPMKKLMLEAHDKGDRIESVAYAMGLLMLKNHIKLLENTAEKISFFVDYTIVQLAEVKPQNLIDLLVKFDESVNRGSVRTYIVHLKTFEKTFDLTFGGDEETKYPKLKLTKLSHRKALAELKAAVRARNKIGEVPVRQPSTAALMETNIPQSTPAIPVPPA